jgi:hypothetical protein
MNLPTSAPASRRGNMDEGSHTLSGRIAAPSVPPSGRDMSAPPPKLLDQLREACRVWHYALTTEDTYHDWCRRFILFHKKRHPNEMGAAEINAFLTHLAVVGQVAASTQNQAFSAVLFLYRNVLQVDPGRIAGVSPVLLPSWTCLTGFRLSG